MSQIVIYQQNAGSVILEGESRKLKESSLGWVPIRKLPSIFLLKAGGGLGADLFVSMVDKVFIDAGLPRPFVIQAGGTRGPVANSHPSELYSYLQIENPNTESNIIDKVIENHGEKPVIVMVDPNFSGKLINLLEDLQQIDQRLNARGIVLVRDELEAPQVIDLLRQVMTTWKGVVEPEFDEIEAQDVVRIPRLPPDLVTQLIREKISLRDCLERQSPGTIVTLARPLRTFAKALEMIYVDSF